MTTRRSGPFISRRRLLMGAQALALWAVSRPAMSAQSRPQSVGFVDYPFKLGVASGDPLADGMVIWTRLAPEPLRGGGVPPIPVPVSWEVALDPHMRHVVRRGVVVARPDVAHSVHVDVQGLWPDRVYWYRFMAGGAVSPLGRSRTFPVLGAPKERLRIAWASCQHFGQGYFSAYRDMVDSDLDLVCHLGDYIYEGPWGQRVRFHLNEPQDLHQYRNLHALYKTDPDLQRAHASFPWAVTWDDHEVDNDYAGQLSQDGPEAQQAFVARRAAAYQAYYEHMPLRLGAAPHDNHMHLYRVRQFGDLATIAILDGRQHRSDQPCPDIEKRRFGGRRIVDCEERLDPDRSMLGRRQERWLHRQLRYARTRWRVIAQPQMMAELDQNTGEDGRDVRWSDAWDGYAATRTRLLNAIQKRRIENVVVLSGDIHQNWVNDLKLDNEEEAAAVLATEFVGTSVTSKSSRWAERHLARNPHVRFHAWRYRGYARAEITPRSWTTEFRAVRNVADPASGVFSLKQFVVASGRAGAEEA